MNKKITLSELRKIVKQVIKEEAEMQELFGLFGKKNNSNTSGNSQKKIYKITYKKDGREIGQEEIEWKSSSDYSERFERLASNYPDGTEVWVQGPNDSSAEKKATVSK